MTPKKLDDEIIKGSVVECAPLDVKKIDSDDIVYIPGRMLSILLSRLEPMHGTSLTKEKLLKQTGEKVKRQIENNRIELVRFDQVEYRKMLDELLEHSKNEEGWTREAWNWQSNRIKANFLDRTGLTSPEIYPFGRILDKDGNVRKNQIRLSDGVFLNKKGAFTAPALTVHEQKGNPYSKYRYAREHALSKKDELLF
tara:strand:+ start:1514 stop:2104 length:591 start_codon:yes stop_codon:yes gene_type:complete